MNFPDHDTLVIAPCSIYSKQDLTSSTSEIEFGCGEGGGGGGEKVKDRLLETSNDYRKYH